jgi:hypothetical protein
MKEAFFSEDIFNASLVSYPAFHYNVGQKLVSCDFSRFDRSSKLEPKSVVPRPKQNAVRSVSNENLLSGRLFPNLVYHFRDKIIKSWPMPYDKDSTNLNHSAAISKIIYYDNIYILS